MTARAPTILISAGEVSGDVIGAHVAAALRRRSPQASLFGLGGEQMAAAGVDVSRLSAQIGVVGVSEALRILPGVVRASAVIRQRVRREPPDAALVIGNDLFNAGLARWLRRRGVPTLAYSPPQVWIWRALLRQVSSGLGRVLASFPDETHDYSQAGVPTTFVGHYLADLLPETTPESRAAARQTLGVAGDGPVVAVLPGSRRHEIQRLAPTLFAAARLLIDRDPRVRLVVPAVGGFAPAIAAHMEACGVRGCITADSHTALRAADAAMCCSGTATLEAALLGVPMAVVYRTSWSTYAVIRGCLALGVLAADTIALPNLVLAKSVVPERKQRQATAAAVAADIAPLLEDGSHRAVMREALREVRNRVQGHGAIDRVARLVLAECEATRTRCVA